MHTLPIALICKGGSRALQMEQQLESMVAMSGAVFFDRGSERTTAPCEFAKLHSALLVALQQRRVHPLKHTLQPMRCVPANHAD